jgi:hypothetical protein
MNRKLKRLTLATLALAILAFGLATAQAGAKVGSWTEIPGYSNLRGYAVVDYVSGSSGSMWRTATGRVQLNGMDSSAIGKIQYAPVARWGPDGDWNTLPTRRGYGASLFSWSDTFHLDYSGFKFRLCGANKCGSARTIYF